ncbi:MAG: hypothetical protein JXB48_15915 [Candidatus Latescibacteria bacterium]|nr:hypothetical protein [Candidatus Latescibacterota bacterium]
MPMKRVRKGFNSVLFAFELIHADELLDTDGSISFPSSAMEKCSETVA